MGCECEQLNAGGKLDLFLGLRVYAPRHAPLGHLAAQTGGGEGWGATALSVRSLAT